MPGLHVNLINHIDHTGDMPAAFHTPPLGIERLDTASQNHGASSGFDDEIEIVIMRDSHMQESPNSVSQFALHCSSFNCSELRFGVTATVAAGDIRPHGALT